MQKACVQRTRRIFNRKNVLCRLELSDWIESASGSRCAEGWIGRQQGLHKQALPAGERLDGRVALDTRTVHQIQIEALKRIVARGGAIVDYDVIAVDPQNGPGGLGDVVCGVLG